VRGRLAYLLFAGTLLAIIGSVVLAATAEAYQSTDFFGQLFGPSTLGGVSTRFSDSRYTLDWHIETSHKVLGQSIAPDIQGTIASMAAFVSNLLWSGARLLDRFADGFFTWAFSLDVITGPHGALRPVARAVQTLYRDVIGLPFLGFATTVAGGYAAWTAWGRGRHGQAMMMLAAGVVYAALVMMVINNPERTLGTAYKGVQTLSGSILSVTDTGKLDPEQARHAASRRIADTLIYRPWLVLNFGGLKHCVAPGGDPVLESDKGPKRCIDNARYAEPYLRFNGGSDQREGVYQAIRAGCKIGDIEGEEGVKVYAMAACARYAFGPADRAAVDIQQQEGAFDRLAIAVLVFVGALAIARTLAWLAVLVILAMVFGLGFFAFAPIMVPLAVLPATQGLVIWWAQRLLGALTVKVAYSLALAVLLTVSGALMGATASMGFALPFALQSALFYGLYKGRRSILQGITSRRMAGEANRSASTYVAKTVGAPVAAVAGIAAVSAWRLKHQSDRQGGGQPPGVALPSAPNLAADVGAGASRNGGAPVSAPAEPPPPPKGPPLRDRVPPEPVIAGAREERPL
jgi:hypothetical protein